MVQTGAGNLNVAPVIYRLIDGNFLRDLCEAYSSELGVDLWPKINWPYFNRSARTFIYDSLPAKKQSQAEEAFEIEYSSRAADLDRLARIPNVFVKDGFSRVRKKIGRQQKGVDILLATDAILFAIRGIADELHIYTNDLDFFPVFEALQSTSCRGRLFHNLERPPNDLIPFADSAEPIRLNDLLEACEIGWGNSNSIYSRDNPSLTGEPIFHGESMHGSLFEVRFDIDARLFEVKYFANGRYEYLRTGSALLVYGIAEKFMKDLPEGLLINLRNRLDAPPAE